MHTDLVGLDALELAPTRVDVAGAWSRRDDGRVEHLAWEGRLVSDEPLAGVLFRADAEGLHWTKSSPAAPSPSLGISLTRYLDSPAGGNLAVRFHDAYVPSSPVAALPTGPPDAFSLGRVETIVACDGISFHLLLLPGSAVRVGRNRLWRARDAVVAALPPRQRAMLQRRRTGSSS